MGPSGTLYETIKMTVMKKNMEYIAPQVEQIIAVTSEVLCSSYKETVTFDDSNIENDHLNW